MANLVTYIKKIWKNAPDTTTPISGANLNHMEDGIDACADAINESLVRYSDVKNNLTSTDTDKPLSANMGKSLAYNYGSSSTSTVAAFVQATQNVSGVSFCTFHVKDTSNIFGLGTNSWLKGMIYYQNAYNSDNDVDGTGFVMKNGTFGSYTVRINGSSSTAYSITKYSTLTANDVVNGLLSTSTTTPLSAAQGKRLYEGKSNLLVRQYEEFTVSTAANSSTSIGTKTWTKTGYRALFAVAKLVSFGDEAAINQYWTINTSDAKAILTGYVRNFGSTTHSIVIGADILWVKND